MKRFQALSFIAVTGLLMTWSCKPKDADYHTDPALFAHFQNKSVATMFVSNPTSTYKIPLGLTQPSATDTKINVTVSSKTGAAAGVQYNLPSSSVTIPAGKLVDSLPVIGLFAGFPGSRVDTLLFK